MNMLLRNVFLLVIFVCHSFSPVEEVENFDLSLTCTQETSVLEKDLDAQSLESLSGVSKASAVEEKVANIKINRAKKAINRSTKSGSRRSGLKGKGFLSTLLKGVISLFLIGACCYVAVCAIAFGVLGSCFLLAAENPASSLLFNPFGPVILPGLVIACCGYGIHKVMCFSRASFNS